MFRDICTTDIETVKLKISVRFSSYMCIFMLFHQTKEFTQMAFGQDSLYSDESQEGILAHLKWCVFKTNIPLLL